LGKNIEYAKNTEDISFLLTENHWKKFFKLPLYRNHGEFMPSSITRKQFSQNQENREQQSLLLRPSTSKRQIATSDDENRSEDDEVENMTNQKLQSKGINSVKRQKTKTSYGKKASAPEKKDEGEEGEEGEEEENDEDDEEEGE
jgi:hypothetical protein